MADLHDLFNKLNSIEPTIDFTFKSASGNTLLTLDMMLHRTNNDILL